MSYLVFARKWRPLTFDDVVGQEHITTTLKKAIEKDRVAHAYIFTGTRGVGKTTTARILARALNCDKGPTAEPCGVCEPCKNIISGSSFDVLEIDGASNNSVEDIREIRDNVRYSSMGGKYRIYVIDEVHMLSKSAFNALLKTLEEPPKNVIFIFATTEPQKIPATIHSRCQRFDFRRISTEQITARLEYICKEESINYDNSALLLVGRKADGSMRDGLSLLDQVYSFSQDKIDEAAVRSALGIISNEMYDTVMAAFVAKDPQPALLIVENVLSNGFDLSEFCSGLLDYVRTMLFSRVPGILNNSKVNLAAGVTETMQKYAEAFSEADLLRMAEIIRKTETELKWSSFPRFLIEIMLLKLVHFDSSVSIETLLKAMGNPNTIAANPPKPVLDDKKKNDLATTPIAESPAISTEVFREPQPSYEGSSNESAEPISSAPSEDQASGQSPKSIQNDWPQFIEYVQKSRPPLGYHLSVAAVIAMAQDRLDLRFPKAFHFQFAEVSKKKHREEIQSALNDFFKTQLTLHITLESPDAGPESLNSVIVGPSKAFASIDDEISNEPIIKNILDIFDGTVI